MSPWAAALRLWIASLPIQQPATAVPDEIAALLPVRLIAESGFTCPAPMEGVAAWPSMAGWRLKERSPALVHSMPVLSSGRGRHCCAPSRDAALRGGESFLVP